MSTCNRLGLETLGSQLVMPKNLPDQWLGLHDPWRLHKVDVHTSVTYLNWTSIVEWCVVRCGSDNKTQEDMCLKIIGLCAQNMWTPLRSRLHHRPWRRTMENNFFPWSDLMVQLAWFNILKKLIYKAFGPSLGVDRMWTKKNDHAPKSECVEFFL